MAQITKDMTIEEALNVDKDIAGILMASGMHCLGCAMASGESIVQAAAVHGIDGEALLARINEHLAGKHTQQ